MSNPFGSMGLTGAFGLGQAGLGQLQQSQRSIEDRYRQAVNQQHQSLSQLFNDSPSLPIRSKNKTILEELQHETDVWLKDIDL